MNRREALKVIAAVLLIGNLNSFGEESFSKEKIISKWKKIGLLEGLSDNKLWPCACLLENQQAFNIDSEYVDKEKFRFSIPMVRRIFHSAAFEFLNCEPFPYFAKGKLNKIQESNVKFDPKNEIPKLVSQFGLDPVAEWVAVLSCELAYNIDRKVIQILSENAIVMNLHRCKFINVFSRLLTIISHFIPNQSNYWIVTSSKMRDLLLELPYNSENSNIIIDDLMFKQPIWQARVGICNDLNIFVKNKFNIKVYLNYHQECENSFLIGSFNNSNIFCPSLIFADYSKENVISDYKVINNSKCCLVKI